MGFLQEHQLLVDSLLTPEGWIKLKHEEWGDLDKLDFDNWRNHPFFPAFCKKIRNKTKRALTDDSIFELVVDCGRRRKRDRIPIPKVKRRQEPKRRNHDWDSRIRECYKGISLAGRKHLIDEHAEITFCKLQSEGCPYSRKEFNWTVNNLRKQGQLS